MLILPTMPLGHHTLGVICSHRLIKNNLKIFKNHTINCPGQQFRLIKPLASSPKHFMLKMGCSDHSQSVMCHPLSTICCIQGFSGILSKTFSEHCSFYNEAKDAFLYILVAFRVAVEEVKLRGQHPNFSKAVFNI